MQVILFESCFYFYFIFNYSKNFHAINLLFSKKTVEQNGVWGGNNKIGRKLTAKWRGESCTMIQEKSGKSSKIQ